MSSYIEQIGALLNQHRREVERLQIAAEVITELAQREADRPKVLHLKAETSEKKTSGKITIRKVTGPADRPKRSHRDNPDRDRYRSSVLGYIDEHGPTRTSELMEHLGLADSSKETKQVLYQVMYDLKRLGTLIRGDDMVYRRAAQETIPSHKTPS